MTHGETSGTGLPSVTLQVQHRMRPEVSNLIRRTMYPELEDHKTTLGRPRVPGVAVPVLFVKHQHPEMQDAEAADLGSKSKVNQHEVAMVCRLAQHLRRQERSNLSIAILTPYLGQLGEIRKHLQKLGLGANLNERDVGDLAKLLEKGVIAGDPSSSISNGNGGLEAGGNQAPAVRAATVDNFQGEEADVVIISLVRSNQRGDIGFLSNAQRVNVLLSRARNGMFIFGNMDCLTNCRSSPGRDLWRSIEAILKEKHQVLDFLPLVCEHHSSVLPVREPEEIAEKSPHGGCTLPCNELLPCGPRVSSPMPSRQAARALRPEVQTSGARCVLLRPSCPTPVPRPG